MNTVNEASTVSLALEGELTIYTAMQTKQRLIESLEQGDGVQIDLSGVSEFDSAGLQLLLVACAEAGRSKKSIKLAGISPAVAEVFQLCGLAVAEQTPPCANRY